MAAADENREVRIGACKPTHGTISARILSMEKVLRDLNSCRPQPALLYGHYDVPLMQFVMETALCFLQYA